MPIIIIIQHNVHKSGIIYNTDCSIRLFWSFAKFLCKKFSMIPAKQIYENIIIMFANIIQKLE